MHQFASVTGLINMILIILLIYFGVKILARLFSPFLARFVIKKAEQRFGQQFGQHQNRQQQKSRKEGEVTIDKMPNRKASNKDVGDYVDFEEID
ncbi:DUF4834 family protein [Seonamhaeicola marinus]|uniref:DUF4834 family protein n=1 Tax=Seonamhaeicola marinus TaxID=1912246 RepID=A0A5D0HKB7_9FLAO|nr:DUF4834 family protein [Seonamhaeicola marinus]TYA71833.1 DUF4834 family protein [Seonamhaeicola marinus]